MGTIAYITVLADYSEKELVGLLGFLPDMYRSGIMHVRINYLNTCLHNGIADNSKNRSVKLSLLTDLPFVHFLVRNSFKFDGVVSFTWHELNFFFSFFHYICTKV